MSDCLFCGMVERKVNADIVFETERVLAFRDINPQAPNHILIIPKEHIATINELQAEHAAVVGELFLAAQHIAAEEGIAERGYRVVMNCGKEGHQDVYHIHLHLLGGRNMSWPPG
jgi:histidine triad (HIT) family protein